MTGIDLRAIRRPQVVGITQSYIALQCCEVFRRAKRRYQGGARHRDDLRTHQQCLLKPWPERWPPVTHGKVDAVGMKMRQTIGGQYSHIQCRVALGQSTEPGDQPLGGESGCHADGDMGRRRAQPARCLIEHGHCRTHGLAIPAASVGQCQASRQAFEQAYLQGAFQPPNLLGHGGLGDTQLFGGQAKIEMPRHDLEHPQGAKGRQLGKNGRHRG